MFLSGGSSGSSSETGTHGIRRKHPQASGGPQALVEGGTRSSGERRRLGLRHCFGTPWHGSGKAEVQAERLKIASRELFQQRKRAQCRNSAGEDAKELARRGFKFRRLSKAQRQAQGEIKVEAVLFAGKGEGEEVKKSSRLKGFRHDEASGRHSRSTLQIAQNFNKNKKRARNIANPEAPPRAGAAQGPAAHQAQPILHALMQRGMPRR